MNSTGTVASIDITDDRIERPPGFGSDNIGADCILGVGKSDKQVIFLLNIGKTLSADDAIFNPNYRAARYDE